MPRPTSDQRWHLAAIGLALAVAASLTACVTAGTTPALALMALAGLGMAAVLVTKYSPLLVAALLYVGNYKTRGATGFSITDPTVVIFALLTAAIAVELLFSCASIRKVTLRERFAGQGRGVLLFAALLVVLSLSYLHTPAPISGREKLLRFAVFETAAFFAPLLLFRDERDFRIFAWACVLLALPLAVRIVSGVAHPTDLQLAGEDDVTRIGDGGLIAISLLLLLYYRFPGRLGRALPFLAIPPLAFGLIASEARGPALSFVIVLVASMTVFRVRSVVPRRTIIIGLLLVAVTIAVSFTWISKMPVIAVRGVHKAMELEGLLHGNLNTGGTTSLRMDYYRTALQDFTEHPVTGIGLSGWVVHFYGRDWMTHPHNFLLEAAAEEGMGGLLILLALLWTSVAALLRVQRARYFALLCVLPALLFNILVNAVTGQIEDRIMFFWLGAAFMVSRMARQPAAGETSLPAPEVSPDGGGGWPSSPYGRQRTPAVDLIARRTRAVK